MALGPSVNYQLHISMSLTHFFHTQDEQIQWDAVCTALGRDPRQANLLAPAGVEHLVYCDGACSGNGVGPDSPGGWGIVIANAQAELQLGLGGDWGVTNNKMELTAALSALRQLPVRASVLLRTDSQYVIKGCTEWRAGWQKRGMRKASGEAVLNQELWLALWEEVDRRRVRMEWVRGHNGDPGNELADSLAVLGIQGSRQAKKVSSSAVPTLSQSSGFPGQVVSQIQEILTGTGRPGR